MKEALEHDFCFLNLLFCRCIILYFLYSFLLFQVFFG